MRSQQLPIGSMIRIEKTGLQAVLNRLKELGYQTIGPRVANSAIVYDELVSIDQLPIGYIDQQDGGQYRLKRTEGDAYFDYVVGPYSLKNFLFPPRETVLQSQRVNGNWKIEQPAMPDQLMAMIGPRSCDLHSLAVLDRVFLQGQFVDPAYKARRDGLFVAAVNCRHAAATCFCRSMKTGPAVTSGFDLALTEMDGYFVVEVGTQRGGEVVAAAEWAPCSMPQVEQAREVPAKLAQTMKTRGTPSETEAGDGKPRGRQLDTRDIHDLLLNNLEHPRWEEVARRCLACANCTMVCPTCFCSGVEEVTDLTGDHVQRERSWSSCFTAEHSYMNTGTVRKSTASRYRQWLTHKLASWHDQFGTSGCVGCGRCITWCPVGIDLTEEVAAIRGE